MAVSTNIPRYGNTQVVADTFDDLRSIPARRIENGYSATVAGALSPADGLGGLYVWNTNSIAVDDGETTIASSDGQPGRWLRIAVGQVGPKGDSITGPQGDRGPHGDPGGNVMSVGLFGTIAQIVIPVGTDLVHTSGHTQRGVGAARYTVGPVGQSVAETRYSTNSINGRGVTLEEVRLTVDMFGAIPDGTTDSLPAFQAGVNYVAARGPGKLEVPGVGAYFWHGGLNIETASNVTLVGHATLEAGGGFITVDAPSFLILANNYVGFSMEGIAAGGLHPLTTDFCGAAAGGRGGGVWSYSSIQNCYFANFRDWNAVILGLHVTNNNFANFRSFTLGGSDNDFYFNYANYDTSNPDSAKPEHFFNMTAMGATGVSHNYFTAFQGATNEPICAGFGICNQVRVVHNQFDGGTVCSFRIYSQSQSVVAYNNRLTSHASWTAQQYVPIQVISSTDCIIRDFFIGTITANDPFIRFDGQCDRILVDGCITTKSNETTYHDSATGLVQGNRVKITGYGVPTSYNCPNGQFIYSFHFDRLITNLNDTANPQIVYLDTAAIKVGDIINCAHADTTRKWVIYDQGQNKIIYDSSTNTGSQFFRVVCLSDGHPTLDITAPPTPATTTGGTS